MKSFYARFVLWLIRPALELQSQRTKPISASEADKEPLLYPESIALLRESVARWLETGDLSQAHLLRDATHKAATVISILSSAENLPSEEEKAPSEPPLAVDTPLQTTL